MARSLFPSSKHHLLPTPHLTASPPTTHLRHPPISSELSSRVSAFPNDPPKNRPRSSPLRSPCKTSPIFSSPWSKALVSPDSFLGYRYLTCAVSQDPMLGIMVWCCLKVLITSGQRPFMFALHQAHRFWSWSLLHLCMWVNDSSYPYPDLSGVPWSEACIEALERSMPIKIISYFFHSFK